MTSQEKYEKAAELVKRGTPVKDAVKHAGITLPMYSYYKAKSRGWVRKRKKIQVLDTVPVKRGTRVAILLVEPQDLAEVIRSLQ